MIPAAFDYERPSSIEEALRILARRDPGTKVICGGQSLLPLLKLRLAEVDTLVDIGRLAELKGIREGADGGVVIGSAVPYREVLESALVEARAPLLTEVIHDIGDVQVRNRGTLGGSLAHADPASDIPAAALALDAVLALRSVDGQRAGPINGFFRGAFDTALKPTELLVEVRIPRGPDGAGAAYRQLSQPASGYSMVGVAAVIARSGSEISHARVAITGVGDVAYRAKAVESMLLGTDGSPSALADAAAHATDGQAVNSDIHADAEYRAAMAVVFTRRALEAALARATS
jgi:aerobic carbon-monoxide dehydrogenase medium subunit